MKKPSSSPYFGASKQKDVPISTSAEIVNQGTIPLAQPMDAPIEAAPKGRQKARGFGLMMRPVNFLVR